MLNVCKNDQKIKLMMEYLIIIQFKTTCKEGEKNY